MPVLGKAIQAESEQLTSHCTSQEEGAPASAGTTSACPHSANDSSPASSMIPPVYRAHRFHPEMQPRSEHKPARQEACKFNPSSDNDSSDGARSLFASVSYYLPKRNQIQSS